MTNVEGGTRLTNVEGVNVCKNEVLKKLTIRKNSCSKWKRKERSEDGSEKKVTIRTFSCSFTNVEGVHVCQTWRGVNV